MKYWNKRFCYENEFKISPIETHIDVDLVNVEHGVLLQTLVDHVTGRAQPDRVDLGVDVAELQSFFQIANPESKVLKFKINWNIIVKKIL